MQKFHKGDLVRVAKNLGTSMSHFTADCDAIVIGSYADQYGGQNRHSYTLYIKNQGETSWYEEKQLTLIESDRIDKLKEWKEEARAERKQKNDIDWIFSNGPDVAQEPHGASIQTLGKCIGLTNLWGNNGEGFVYYANAMYIMKLASPFLKNNDKDGWLAFCKSIKF